MKTNVALIGFMGTGKTAVGRLLAQKLGKEFVEIDALIEQRAGKSIPQIFRERGETAFRELEIEAVKQSATRQNTVIACGGGVVLNWINVDRLRQEGTIVLLTASPAVICQRAARDGDTRPLLRGADAESVRKLLTFRKPFYDRAADVRISTSRLTVAGVVDNIVRKLDELNSCQK